MRDFFKNKLTIAAIVIIALILITSALLMIFTDSNTAAHKVAGTIVYPFQRLFTAARSGVTKFISAQTRYNELLEENEALKEQIREMDALVRNAEQYKLDNDRLRELLDMRIKNPEKTIHSALIIAWNDTNWSSVFTINKGTKDDVAKGNCVLTEDGLVGIVTRAEENFAEVSTIIDTTTSFGAVAARTGVMALARGNFELMKQNKLKLLNIASGSDVKPGDYIMTSGVGTLIPPDILIGRVDYVKAESHGMSDYAVIVPAVNMADFKNISDVFVITDFEAAN